nr:unnamed protein product [Callosobruchus analis]
MIVTATVNVDPLVGLEVSVSWVNAGVLDFRSLSII